MQTPTFKVTQGDESRDIQAANKREALRRFENDDQRVEAELVTGDERIPGLLPSGTSEPSKRRYKVTWGEIVREVVAVHKDDAWSQFVGGKTDTQEWKFPNLYERVIEDLGPADDGGKTEPADVESDESPVEGDSVADAKDKILRMRSVEKLQEIAANDHRVSVRDAASKRLQELTGE
jgi:hypothetical protein